MTLDILEEYSEKVVDQYKSESPIRREDSEGFKSRFLPNNTSERYNFESIVAFKRTSGRSGYRFSNMEVLIHDLIEERDSILRCNLIL